MTGPFTPEELILIEVANQSAELLGHHHHGHGHHHDDHGKHEHKQSEFKRPEKLTTSLGLYALKKLEAINPTFLTVRESRLLQPVTPGPITYFINAGFYISAGLYGAYLWRTRGIRGFGTLAVLPFAGLIAGRYITNEGLSYLRDFFYFNQRKAMVNSYAGKYGEDFLLDVLNPSFRL